MRQVFRHVCSIDSVCPTKANSFSSLETLELRPILLAVTPLALLALWLAFPAGTPQHRYDNPPTNGKAPRTPLASAAAGLAREVSFHAC